MKATSALLGMALLCSGLGQALPSSAQQLDARFSCGESREDHGMQTFFADSGEFKFNGGQVAAFRWESSIFRSTHGLECSIDAEDGVQAEFIGDNVNPSWRVVLNDAEAARDKRGYDYSHGLLCSIRIDRVGDSVQVHPSCPAMCGSRPNFTEFSFDLKTGTCRYGE